MDLLDFFRDTLSAQAILDYIDGLPRNSCYMAAIAEDDELADAVLAEEDGDEAEPSLYAPRLTEFGTVESLLTDIKDGQAVLVRVVANWGSGKAIKPPTPSPRPITAAQRARQRRTAAQHERLKAALLPHKYGTTTPE